MTADPDGWPFHEQPGVPLNPEWDGAHIVRWDGKNEPWLWRARARGWVTPRGSRIDPITAVRAGTAYIGPCLTPAHIKAMLWAVVRAAGGEVTVPPEALNAAPSGVLSQEDDPRTGGVTFRARIAPPAKESPRAHACIPDFYVTTHADIRAALAQEAPRDE